MCVELFEIEKIGGKGAWNSGSSAAAASSVTEGGMMMAESSIVLHFECL